MKEIKLKSVYNPIGNIRLDIWRVKGMRIESNKEILDFVINKDTNETFNALKVEFGERKAMILMSVIWDIMNSPEPESSGIKDVDKLSQFLGNNGNIPITRKDRPELTSKESADLLSYNAQNLSDIGKFGTPRKIFNTLKKGFKELDDPQRDASLWLAQFMQWKNKPYTYNSSKKYDIVIYRKKDLPSLIRENDIF